MPGRQRMELPQVAVNGQVVMELLHEKYAGLIGQIMHENAQAQAAIETLQMRNMELEGQLGAMRDAAKVVSVTRPEGG